MDIKKPDEANKRNLILPYESSSSTFSVDHSALSKPYVNDMDIFCLCSADINKLASLEATLVTLVTLPTQSATNLRGEKSVAKN